MKLKLSFMIIMLNILFSTIIFAQTVPQGITYQGIARNSSGNVISSQSISVKLGIYSTAVSGTLQWEETHAVTANQLGLFYFIIGQGTSTGNGASASFASINWAAAPHFVKISMDENGGTSFTDIDTIQFLSVPYAMHSASSDQLTQSLRLHDLSDVDTIGIVNGYVLKWNGSLWHPAPDLDSDTASFAISATHSVTSDTAVYALNVLSVVDTVLFSENSDTTAFALNSNTSLNSLNSVYSDTATYALSSGSSYTYWNLSGNSGTNPAADFVGTADNSDFVLKTNNIERMRITATGKIGIGTIVPTASFHIVGNDGFLSEGTYGTGNLPASGGGTRMMWYPKKAAFRAGAVAGNQWDDAKVGIYSFATNYNSTASGAYATAFGNGCTASGTYSIVGGDGSIASGFGAVAIGSACSATGPNSIALARAAVATDSGSIAIGYHNEASGKYALSFGYGTFASGDYSTVMGYYANSNNKKGSFVFADASSTAQTKSNANNQFMVRAAGGYMLYSNSSLTSGVTLTSGSGSWASVSDKNKKEHFRNENAEAILNKLIMLDITSWNYKSQSSSIRHIGPMAQDFYKAFHLGDSDTTITTVDVDGVSLLAIQALSQKTKELKQKADEVEKLKLQVANLEKEKLLLEKRIIGIEQKLNLSPVSITAANK